MFVTQKEWRELKEEIAGIKSSIKYEHIIHTWGSFSYHKAGAISNLEDKIRLIFSKLKVEFVDTKTENAHLEKIKKG